MVVVETGLGFSNGGEVSVFSGDDFWGLGNWNWCAMSVGVSRNSPVGDSWNGVVGNNRCGLVVRSDGMNWSWSLWQVGGVDDLESVVWVSDVLD